MRGPLYRRSIITRIDCNSEPVWRKLGMVNVLWIKILPAGLRHSGAIPADRIPDCRRVVVLIILISKWTGNQVNH